MARITMVSAALSCQPRRWESNSAEISHAAHATNTNAQAGNSKNPLLGSHSALMPTTMTTTDRIAAAAAAPCGIAHLQVLASRRGGSTTMPPGSRQQMTQMPITRMPKVCPHRAVETTS